MFESRSAADHRHAVPASTGGSRFVHRSVLGFSTIDEVLRLLVGTMMKMALEPRVRGDLPDDESAYSS